MTTVLKELAQGGKGAWRLKKTRLVVGLLHQIVPESLTFAYEVLTKDTPAKGSVLEIRLVPIVARCRVCGWKGEIHDSLFVCGACSGGDLETIAGKELFVESLEVEEHDG